MTRQEVNNIIEQCYDFDVQDGWFIYNKPVVEAFGANVRNSFKYSSEYAADPFKSGRDMLCGKLAEQLTLDDLNKRKEKGYPFDNEIIEKIDDLNNNICCIMNYEEPVTILGRSDIRINNHINIEVKYVHSLYEWTECNCNNLKRSWRTQCLKSCSKYMALVNKFGCVKYIEVKIIRKLF